MSLVMTNVRDFSASYTLGFESVVFALVALVLFALAALFLIAGFFTGTVFVSSCIAFVLAAFGLLVACPVLETISTLNASR